jgi:hypothetical protein
LKIYAVSSIEITIYFFAGVPLLTKKIESILHNILKILELAKREKLPKKFSEFCYISRRADIQ